MFSVNALRRKLTTSRVAMLAAPLALAGLAAPMMGAGPWDWHSRREGRRVEVVIGNPPRVVVRPAIVDEVPCDLRITAYKAHDTIMVMVNGSNRTGGYMTSLSAIDTRGHCPELLLRNTRPTGMCTQAITPISLNGAFETRRSVSSIKVKVADRVIVVPVCEVACLQ